MPIRDDVDVSEFRRMDEMEKEYYKDLEKSRVIKKCKTCGQPYSYEKGMTDPKECQDCRGDLGRLIY